jgi:GxxExxY protein
VHRHLGPGLLESLYRECLLFELRARGLKAIVEELIPIFYKGQRLSGHYRIDLLVEDSVIVELKSMETVLPVHYAQVLTCLRLTETGWPADQFQRELPEARRAAYREQILI